jgi:hypothetical protein
MRYTIEVTRSLSVGILRIGKQSGVQYMNPIISFAMKKSSYRKGHEYHIDGLGTIGIIFGIACVGLIFYSVFQVIFS